MVGPSSGNLSMPSDREHLHARNVRISATLPLRRREFISPAETGQMKGCSGKRDESKQAILSTGAIRFRLPSMSRGVRSRKEFEEMAARGRLHSERDTVIPSNS